jgi:hypothetical protein
MPGERMVNGLRGKPMMMQTLREGHDDQDRAKAK